VAYTRRDRHGGFCIAWECFEFLLLPSAQRFFLALIRRVQRGCCTGRMPILWLLLRGCVVLGCDFTPSAAY
jgi:hypothetical protein